jgi:NitT/TauT family transport system permease protein
VSSEVIETLAPPDVAEEVSVAPGATRAGSFPLAAAAVLAPIIAAAVALTIHQFVPTRQEILLSWLRKLPTWQHPYRVLLEILLAVSLLGAIAHATWWPARPWVRHYGPLLAGGIIVLCLWELVTAKLDWMEQPYFPGPNEVLAGLIEDRGILALSTWYSLQLLLSGYATGAVTGVVTGVLIGWFPRVRYWGMPVLKIVGPIPATALVPLVMMISKETYPCAVALIGFAVWFPVTMLTSSGITNVRLSYLDVARTLGGGRLYLIFRVAIPSALPNIFIGLFMGLGASFLTVIVAETLGVKAGLGHYLLWRKGATEYAKVYASLIIMAVFFSTLMTLLFKLRDFVLKWQKGVIKW